MWAIVAEVVKGLVSGVVGPAFAYLDKKQDTTLDGYKAGLAVDGDTYKDWLAYQTQIETLKLQANGWWGPRALYMVIGAAAAFHTAAVMLDSIPFGIPHLWTHAVGGWVIPPLPGVYATYEGWVVGSLFVVSLASQPLSAATAWLHSRTGK